MPRKGENIYKRKDGRFEARFITSRDEEGKARYKAVYGYSKAEVREKLEAAKRELFGVPFPVEGRTFREVAEEWLSRSKGRIAATTYDRYLDALERDVYPEYGETPMKDVTEAEMNRFLKVWPDLAKKRGRTAGKSTLQILRTVMGGVLHYVKEEYGEKTDISYEKTVYEELSSSDVEQLCHHARWSHCPEMLAALLALYCGMRIGEICAVHCDDIDLDKMEIHIHRTAHRVRNPDKESSKKTAIVLEEMPRKVHIRHVDLPEAMREYVEEYMAAGKLLLRGSDGVSPMDPRTLEGRFARVMASFHMDGLNFERLRKTYRNGRADVQVLTDAFSDKSDAPEMYSDKFDASDAPEVDSDESNASGGHSDKSDVSEAFQTESLPSPETLSLDLDTLSPDSGTLPSDALSFDTPSPASLDVQWLTEEMGRDLAPLRLLTGYSIDEVSSITGISEGMYRSLENGSRTLSWNQYLALLFMFRYNARTVAVVDTLGLFPNALQDSLTL